MMLQTTLVTTHYHQGISTQCSTRSAIYANAHIVIVIIITLLSCACLFDIANDTITDIGIGIDSLNYCLKQSLTLSMSMPKLAKPAGYHHNHLARLQ